MELKISSNWICPVCCEHNPLPNDFYNGANNAFETACCASCGSNFQFTRPTGKHVATIKQIKSDKVETLCLLKYHQSDIPLFLVIKDIFPIKENEFDFTHYYDESTCPTNYLPKVIAIVDEGDLDPHGVFQFVRSVSVDNALKQLNVDRVTLFGAMNESLIGKLFPEVLKES